MCLLVEFNIGATNWGISEMKLCKSSSPFPLQQVRNMVSLVKRQIFNPYDVLDIPQIPKGYMRNTKLFSAF